MGIPILHEFLRELNLVFTITDSSARRAFYKDKASKKEVVHIVDTSVFLIQFGSSLEGMKTIIVRFMPFIDRGDVVYVRFA